MDTFATAINCMDGRVQEPVINYIKEKYGVDYVDKITKAGPNKILAEEKDRVIIEIIREKASISVNAHKSQLIAVVGHYDCAGNPAGEEVQKKQILAASRLVSSWGFKVRIIGLWVDSNWKVHEVSLEKTH